LAVAGVARVRDAGQELHPGGDGVAVVITVNFADLIGS
jgi:hypothetical protein